MNLRLEQLQRELDKGVSPVYLVSGDETLLVEEACDAIIAAARAAGYTERSVHYAEGSFNWHELMHDGASLSLFAERKILDVRANPNKLDKQASEVLREWVDTRLDSETVLLIRTARLDGSKAKSAWFKALDKAGVVLRIWPVEIEQFPHWLAGRLKTAGLTLAPEALQYLADKVQGNLLAAVQEIHKLTLQDMPSPLSLEAVVSALEDASRFTSFDAIDAVFTGNPERADRVLEALKEEGLNPIAVLSAFVALLRRVDNTRGLPVRTVDGLKSFVRRIGSVAPVLAECAVVDQQVKGQRGGDAWLSLRRLFLRLAGLRSLELPSRERARVELT